MLSGLSAAAGVTYVSIPADLFQRGIDPKEVGIEVEYPETGYCFAGYRRLPEPAPPIETARTVLLVRDPRDAIVSYYFSVRDSHVLPEVDTSLRDHLLARRAGAKAVSIDRWVLEHTRDVADGVSSYLAHAFLSRPNVVTYRYEDIIFRKRAWAAEILAWYGWNVRGRVIDRVVRKYDVFPDTADPSRHVRQVYPGNYRKLLEPATQRALTEAFADILTAFGYER